MSHSPETEALLASRYGTERDPRKRRRGVLAAIAVLTVAIIVFVIVAALANRSPQVHAEHLAYRSLSDTEVEVTFNLTGPIGGTVVCGFEALSENFTQVGYLETTIGPLEARTQSVSVTVPTVEPAAAATVEGCRLAEGD